MNKAGKILIYILFAAAFIVLMGAAVMILWNWLIPELFNGPVITFVQSLGLLLLFKVLTGFGGMGHKKWGDHSHRHSMWKKKWDAKMEGMSEEEKARFKEMYYKRCGKVPPSNETNTTEKEA